MSLACGDFVVRNKPGNLNDGMTLGLTIYLDNFVWTLEEIIIISRVLKCSNRLIILHLIQALH